MEKYAVIPEGTDMSNVIDLTIGKRYKVLELCNAGGFLNKGVRFCVLDDVGFKVYSSENKSLHLNGQNWEIQQ